MSVRTFLMCSVPGDVHAPVFSKCQMPAADIANSNRAAANAVDGHGRGKSRTAIARANVIEIALSRVALEINHVDRARSVNRHLRLNTCIGHTRERYLASVVELGGPLHFANGKHQQR